MRFMLLICGDESEVVSPAEHMAMPEFIAWYDGMERQGRLRGGERLRPSAEGATVRVRDGEVLASDGPFAETKEQMGGFAIIECADLDDAVEKAAQHPVAQYGAIEVRPIWEF